MDNFNAKKTYALYRLDKSKEDLEAAKLMLEQGQIRLVRFNQQKNSIIQFIII